MVHVLLLAYIPDNSTLYRENKMSPYIRGNMSLHLTQEDGDVFSRIPKSERQNPLIKPGCSKDG